MADQKISDLSAAGALQAADQFVIARGANNYKKALAGMPELIYRYTVTGSDKASIDTGVDTADAGTNDWSNGDLLEIFFYSRTDEAVVSSAYLVTLNNDGSSIYDSTFLQNVNATVSGGNTLAAAAWNLNTAGASCASGVFGVTQIAMPNFAGTVANKFAVLSGGGFADTTAANIRTNARQLGYRSTTAISRFAVAPATAAKKFKVGTQLLIYKRLAA